MSTKVNKHTNHKLISEQLRLISNIDFQYNNFPLEFGRPLEISHTLFLLFAIKEHLSLECIRN